MFDWNDLKAFLAVARGGSTLAAAKALGINQTTVARRIEALETAIELKLFERGQAGTRLTEAGQALICEAEGVERANQGFLHQAQALRRGMSGTLRVTINEALANVFLAQAIAEFRRTYPDIKIEMLVGDAFLDLNKGEADIALRGTTALADSDLIARKLSDVPWAVYCSRSYAIEHGFPETPEGLSGHILIGGDVHLARLPALKWMSEVAPDAEVHTRSSTFTNLATAVKAGLGLAPLPQMVSNHDPDLLMCMEITAFPSAMYILVRPDMKDVPRVRAFTDFLSPNFTTTRRTLEEKGRLMQAEARREVAEARMAARAKA